jgi:uncharacterized protein involved in type VI secretion and phage assembly
MAGKINGALIGTVVNAIDPQGAGRAQVRLPQVAGAPMAWAPVCQAFGGGSAGTPQIGASVVVVFENGDPDHPIILGTLG